ncbi:alpha/beta hydrolase [Nocardia abscessus]|uniref:Alpha/beta hydrolase n=1 Tax=Nocardia abscessus TaxID=120957 RepID=A0ABS0CGW3_9NOCA|nr:alpha/beta hydrolase [Nocardia abscessus]MBF6229582.1 alpha/beta hydrolase [Nocardia abscessus]
MRSETVKVPGATLYYEVSGAGPVLLLLPGSGGDAAVFDPVVEPLAEHFTVVTVDPRGYSRSALDPGRPADVEWRCRARTPTCCWNTSHPKANRRTYSAAAVGRWSRWTCSPGIRGGCGW